MMIDELLNFNLEEIICYLSCQMESPQQNGNADRKSVV